MTAAGSDWPVRAPITRLVLIRHGESRASVEGVVGGERGCRGLTPLGRCQAAALLRRLTSSRELAGAAALLSSHLRRASETAEIVAPAVGHLTVIRRRALAELDPGEGDGLTWAAWEQRYGRFDLAADPHRPIAPGAESWAAFGARARRALGAVARDHVGSTVAVCCHAGIIEQSVVLGFGLDPLTPPGRSLEIAPNASITEWCVTTAAGQGHPHRDQRWTLVRFADAAHLASDSMSAARDVEKVEGGGASARADPSVQVPTLTAAPATAVPATGRPSRHKGVEPDG